MDNFDSDAYFRELIQTNKIREKLRQARLKRNNLIASGDENEKKKTPSLLSRIVTSKELARRTTSGDTLQSYNGGSIQLSSETLSSVKLKLRTDSNLPTSYNELRERFKEEKKKQMELLETIRLLRGIGKLDFYIESENNSDDGVCVWEHEIVTADNKNEKLIDDENGSQKEPILSPIANQLLTPERVPTPECYSLAANISPDPQSSMPPSPEPEPSTKTSGCKVDTRWPKGHKFYTKPRKAKPIPDEHTSSHSVASLMHAESLDNMIGLNTSSKIHKKTLGCQVDTRWPKGHRFFTKPLRK